jgi:hypothetical protein
MGHQIRFYLSETLIMAVENEARRIGVKLRENHPEDADGIQFSRSSGNDTKVGRLWTQAEDASSFMSLCKAVKTSAYYDKESALWVKRESKSEFEDYRTAEKARLADLVASNRKHALEVLGGRIADHKDGQPSAGPYGSPAGSPSGQP